MEILKKLILIINICISSLGNFDFEIFITKKITSANMIPVNSKPQFISIIHSPINYYLYL